LNSNTNYDNARNSSSTGFDSSSSSSSSSGLNGFTRISISSDDENDENDDDKKALNSEEPSLLPGFTRISIIDDDDDDEEEESDDEGDKNAGIHKNIPSDAKSSEFTRINICDDDDDDDSDEGNSLGSSQSPPAANASSSNNVAINDSVESAETSEWAIESLRTEALQCIADGKADKAIQALEKAIKLSETDAKQGSISSSLLILLASAQSAAGDDNAAVCTCTRVLSADKRNYKALMRRAEAYFRLVSIRDCLQDLFYVFLKVQINKFLQFFLFMITE
jgi:tetratricopeptide (TPR) repeat protein